MNRATFLDELALQRPVVQAGMAGGVDRGELAGAVSAAGGLGTVGMMGVSAFAQALADARRRAGARPVAANLLVPFIRRGHVERAADDAALTVLHGGISRRWTSALRQRGARVLITVGTREQAIRAIAAGANGLVVQGIEAGGHLVGTEPVTSALPRILEVAGELPVLAAGGVAEAADVRRLLDLGAVAAIAGTRFLLTEESAAHPQYKRRVMGSQQTLATQLFGLGWPLLHRVVPNQATERWCARSELGPVYARLLARASAPIGRLAPLEAMGSLAAWQRPALPLFSPALPLAGMPDSAVERTALYAGETARRLQDIIPAEEAVLRLTP
ncbi:MAG TPA: nitronate monooxygenase [Solirubrobacteraceae bacterium]|jgi:NAD(P)H-dependent flavin oxidoreductase YrpB (nitropropane dioxygenase family)